MIFNMTKKEINDLITHDNIPSYVKEQTRIMIEKVQSHLRSDSIVFLAASDSHHNQSTQYVPEGNLHAGMALKSLAYNLPLDFVTYLGDYTAGSNTTTIAEGISHIKSINADIDEAFKGLPQFRTVGNHDPLGYSYKQNETSLTPAQLYSLIGKYNADSGAVMGSVTSGYCYRDFPSKQVRVICLNTAEKDSDGKSPPQGSAEYLTPEQKVWFADTLISTPQDYGIIILSHHPLDWGKLIIQASHILRAYVEELAPAQQNQINFGSGVTRDFTGKNKSAWVICFHGHVHTFTQDKLHYVENISTSTTSSTYDVMRIATPNTCYGRNNEYGNNGHTDYYDIEYGTLDTYNKTANSGQDTAFCVYVINPSEEKVYAISYGSYVTGSQVPSGIDRTIYWGNNTVAVTGVTLNRRSGTLTPGNTVTLTATVQPANATNQTVTWTSSDSSIATVSNGTVTAVAVGTATITATTQDGGYTATYTLTVEAAKRGNLRDYLGYTDGKRISTSNGDYRDLTGGTVVEYIDLSEFRQSDNTVVIRTKGVNFKQVSSPYNNNAYAFYNASKGFTAAGYLSSGSGAHGNITLTKAFDDDADNTMTLTISGLSSSAATTSYHYMRLCGLGSGADLDIRVNEDFDEGGAVEPEELRTEVYFDDRNDDVKDYLTASSIYTDANRSNTSVISQYASTSVEDQDCPKPFLTHYNLTPGTANTIDEFSVIPFGYPPRMLKLSGMWNVRDCGGWACDGGKVRYGKLFRGSRLNSATADDLALLADVGIKFELDVRDSGNASGSTSISGATYQNVAINNAYATMITSEATAAANACIAAMQSIVNGNPVYIHCASGADRTGCICAMLEAILGMSDTDIDREFELTNFADIENLTGHVRNGGSWTGFWAALPTTEANSKMNVAKFLRDNGATTSLLNSFRQAMIDGSPNNIDIPTWSVTNNLTDCTTSNNAASVDGGSSYTATITPASGYTMQTLTVTMGGTDITSTAVSSNVITIVSVSGNIVVTAVAQQQTSYTNLVRTSEAVDSSSVYNNGLGYKNGYYISNGNESANANDSLTGCIAYEISSSTQPTDILYIKGYTGTAGASHTRLCCRNSSKTKVLEYNGFLSSNTIFDIEVLDATTGYYKLTPKSGIHHSVSNVAYMQFSFNQPDASGIVITRNEPLYSGRM